MHLTIFWKSLPEIALLSLSCKRHLCLLTFNLGLRLLCIEWHTQFSFMQHFVAWPKDIFLFWYLFVLVLSFFFFYLVLHLVACPDAKISFCFRPFSVCRKDYSILSDSHKDDQQQKCLHPFANQTMHCMASSFLEDPEWIIKKSGKCYISALFCLRSFGVPNSRKVLQKTWKCVTKYYNMCDIKCGSLIQRVCCLLGMRLQLVTSSWALNWILDPSTLLNFQCFTNFSYVQHSPEFILPN